MIFNLIILFFNKQKWHGPCNELATHPEVDLTLALPVTPKGIKGLRRWGNENKHTGLSKQSGNPFFLTLLPSFRHHIEWTKVNWTTVAHIYVRSPNAYFYRSSSLLHWAMGPHTGVKSSLVIKCPHNSDGMECVRSVEVKVKPPWKSYTLRTAVLYNTEIETK